MMKKSGFLSFIFLILFSSKSLAQNCISHKDTVYAINLLYTLKNGNPVSSIFVLKDLATISSLKGKKTQKEFLCWFYQNAVVFDYPITAVSDFYKCYSFNTTSEKKNFFKSLFKKVQNMNKSYCSYQTREFQEIGNNIQLNCLKLYGDFWISDNETIISDQVYSDQCPHKVQEYDLKEIFQFWKLTKEEEKAIKLGIR